MKRRFLSLILCCGVAFSTIMPAAAEEISDNLLDEEITFDEILDGESGESAEETAKEEVKEDETEGEEAATDSNDKENETTEDNKGSFDIDEPLKSEEECDDSDVNSSFGNIKSENVESAEQLVPLAATVVLPDDNSKVYNSSVCLDLSNNKNKYWQAYYRGEKDTAPTVITVSAADQIVEMKTNKIKLINSDDHKVLDPAVISKAHWNGKALQASTVYASAGAYLMSSGTESGIIGAAKGFKAPKTGTVKISQENLYDNNSNKIWGTGSTNGVVVEVYKNGYANKNIIFSATLDDTNGGIQEFAPITLDVSEGDILYFETRKEVSDTGKTNNWVHFNPVVEYTKLNPTVTAQSPSVAELEKNKIETDQTFSVTYREELDSISKDNVLITGTKKDGSALLNVPAVKSVSLANNTITMSFEGIEMGASYNITLQNLKFKTFSADGYTYKISFNTIDAMAFDKYKASDYFSASTVENAPWTTTWRTSTEWFKTDGLKKMNSSGSWSCAVTIDGAKYQVGSNAWTNVNYVDGFGIGQYTMSPGNTGKQSSTLNSDYPSKTFTAPNSGTIEISACDPSGESYIHGSTGGANLTGSTVLVWKTSVKGGNPVVIWPADGEGLVLKHDSTVGHAKSAFEPFTISVEKGDKLHFEVQGTSTANWWGSLVYWNPVVEYKAISPVITSQNFEDGKTYAPNYTFEMNFDKRMTDLSKSNITIDGGAYVAGVEMKNGGKTVAFTFGGIKEDTKYNVTVSGLIYRAVADQTNTSSQQFSFTSGKQMEIGNFALSGGAVSKGNNTVSVDVNNSEANKNVTLLVLVMKGTESEYSIVSAECETKSVGANDSISKTVNVADAENVFLRCVLVDSLGSMKPYGTAVDLK